jgi:hypothetical protein
LRVFGSHIFIFTDPVVYVCHFHEARIGIWQIRTNLIAYSCGIARESVQINDTRIFSAILDMFGSYQWPLTVIPVEVIRHQGRSVI